MNTPSASDRIHGTLLGLAMGDAFGAPFEGGPIERLVWALIGKTRDRKRRWTDDTQMSLDLAASLIAHGKLDPDDAARRFAKSYRWSRGYGPAAAKTLVKIGKGVPWQEANRATYKEGSLGNGGAMRAPILGVFFASERDKLVEAAQVGASITHAHPLGVDASVMIAIATAEAFRGAPKAQIIDAASEDRHLDMRAPLAHISALLDASSTPNASDLQNEVGVGMLANESPITALYAACAYLEKDYEEMFAFLTSCGGDVDTMCAIAGAIWGASRGASALPKAWLDDLEGVELLTSTADQLVEVLTARESAPE